MSENLTLIASLAAAIGSGVVAGLFYAFSFCVMEAFDRQPASQAANTMRAVNETIIRPVFFFLFFGTGLAVATAGTIALTVWQPQVSLTLLAAAVLYLGGVVAVTLLANVPLNNRLATMTPGRAADLEFWKHYRSKWTTWNHVRLLSALAAAVLFTIAGGLLL